MEESSDQEFILKIPRRYSREVAKGIGYTANLDYHYLLELKKQVPHLFPLWEHLMLNPSPRRNQDEIIEYLNGLMVRLQQVSLSLRIMRELDSQEANNDVEFLANYFLSHFISTVKTLGDNLAWALKFFYGMGLNDEMKIGLLSRSFQEELRSKDNHLAEKLLNSDQFRAYTSIKGFRDVVQHRHAIHVILVKPTSGPGRLMVPVNPLNGAFGKFDFPTIAKVEDKKSIAKFGLKQMVIKLADREMESYKSLSEFCEGHAKSIENICDTVFERLFQLSTRKQVGEVRHYYDGLGVAAISLSAPVNLGDLIQLEGRKTSFIQKIDSMQAEHSAIALAASGQDVAIRIVQGARKHDLVYKL